MEIDKLLSHPFMLSDWIFTVSFCVIAARSRFKCAYGKANILLAGQVLITIGFTTLVIAAGAYDGAYFNLFMAVIYAIFYHLIDNTGDRYLSKLSLWIAAFNFSLFLGEIIGLQDMPAIAYGWTMTAFMIAQLFLAMGGLFYGIDQRINYALKWGHNHRNGNL